jgi:hypothetical protein
MKKTASDMFAFGNRAVCPSCKKPLWQCLCRLPFGLLFNSKVWDRDTDAMCASEGVVLLGLTESKQTYRQKEGLLDYWTLKLGVFALRDRLRSRRKFTIVCLSVGRLQASSSGGKEFGSDSILRKTDTKTQSL